MTFIKALSPRAVLVLPGLLAVCFAAVAQTGPQPRLETVQLSAGMHLIRANEGMLFVNTNSGVRCFWMRNTLIPLTIAFIADDGTIVNLADMQPRSDESHCSAAPVRYALEMNQGWFAKRGIKPGQRLRGGPFGP
jgi:hypothetical protein